MKGYIGFSQLKIHCIIGVYPQERLAPQWIHVDLKVQTDFSKSTKSDDVIDTINYELLAQLCTDLAQKKKFNLLETFAAEALDEILARFDVSKAWICIKKPGGLSAADYTSIEMELDKHAK